MYLRSLHNVKMIWASIAPFPKFHSFARFFSFFYAGVNSNDADDVHAALALMYGYAARYAPSTVIEARIDALVV